MLKQLLIDILPDCLQYEKAGRRLDFERVTFDVCTLKYLKLAVEMFIVVFLIDVCSDK